MVAGGAPTREVVTLHMHSHQRTLPTNTPERDTSRRSPRAPGRLARSMVLSAAALLFLVAVDVNPASPAPRGAESLTEPPVPGPAPGMPTASSDPNVAKISEELSGVRVDSAEYRVVKRAFDGIASARRAASELRVSSEQRIASLQARDAELTTLVIQETARKKQVQVQLAGLRASVRSLAVASYVQGAVPEPDDINAATEVLAQRAEIATVNASQRNRVDVAERSLRDLLARLDADVTARVSVRNDIEVTKQAQAKAAADEARLTQDLVAKQTELTQARARALVSGTDMTLLAMDAYWRAAREAAATRPQCGIAWWALAGIGRIEGRHGTFGGARLLGSGDATPRIIGIPLDGTNNTALIPDTDGGQLDGDPVYDRAVGPMQFIPSTWARWRADGNGDGRADPNNMYDATEAAAHYLCASGPMQTEDDLRRGYFSYNRSDDYASTVLANALYYSNIVIPPPSPDAQAVSPLAASTPVASGG